MGADEVDEVDLDEVLPPEGALAAEVDRANAGREGLPRFFRLR